MKRFRMYEGTPLVFLRSAKITMRTERNFTTDRSGGLLQDFVGTALV